MMKLNSWLEDEPIESSFEFVTRFLTEASLSEMNLLQIWMGKLNVFPKQKYPINALSVT